MGQTVQKTRETRSACVVGAYPLRFRRPYTERKRRGGWVACTHDQDLPDLANCGPRYPINNPNLSRISVLCSAFFTGTYPLRVRRSYRERKCKGGYSAWFKIKVCQIWPIVARDIPSSILHLHGQCLLRRLLRWALVQANYYVCLQGEVVDGSPLHIIELWVQPFR